VSNPPAVGSGRRTEVGFLEFGSGLEVLLAAAFAATKPGEAIDIVTPSHSVALELPGWARAEGNDTLDEWREGSLGQERFVVRVRRGASQRVLAPTLPGRGAPLPLNAKGDLRTATLMSVEKAAVPDVGETTYGLVPVGAIPEAGGPDFEWDLNTRDELWAEELADLTDRASAQQWDATKDIPWEAAAGLPDDVEQAVAQVMTFIAANEYAALYVPSRFLPRVNPAFADILMWLSGHVHDEARHLEVFTKRALAGGARGYSLASTQLSLHTLMEEEDFSCASLLLNVLGEGTFLDLLSFVAKTAPDQATATAARLAHRDELRHVHFGISHVRRTLRLDPEASIQLRESVENRAAKLASLTGLGSILVESLTIMAAGSMNPKDLSEAAGAVASLTKQMEENRIRRLKAAGFDAPTARHLSDLHTPNLM